MTSKTDMKQVEQQRVEELVHQLATRHSTIPTSPLRPLDEEENESQSPLSVEKGRPSIESRSIEEPKGNPVSKSGPKQVPM